ncbi:hypothetical protein E0Z10_g1903 [Xylaria hypoxylon]|uniref:Uncharacterized protein n=1 Tax=Xylaria hypoxylon TaxID=37992 RepID=A0A4Z0Z5X7_9PEZI|nr:hypothetical protein E0Z10_g1903 [Xylaria hypoxylon]
MDGETTSSGDPPPPYCEFVQLSNTNEIPSTAGPDFSKIDAELTRLISEWVDETEISSTHCQNSEAEEPPTQSARAPEQETMTAPARSKKLLLDEVQRRLTWPVTRIVEGIKAFRESWREDKRGEGQRQATPAIEEEEGEEAAGLESKSREELRDRMTRTDAWIHAVEHEDKAQCWVFVHPDMRQSYASGNPDTFIWGRELTTSGSESVWIP